MNAKFRFYIVCMSTGEVKGTHKAETAHEYAQCEEYFVIDAVAGEGLYLNDTTPAEEV